MINLVKEELQREKKGVVSTCGQRMAAEERLWFRYCVRFVF